MKHTLTATVALALSGVVLAGCGEAESNNPNDGVYRTQSTYLVDTGEVIWDPNLEMEVSGRDCVLSDNRFKDVSKKCTLDFENGVVNFEDGTREPFEILDGWTFRMGTFDGNIVIMNKKND